MKVTSDQFDFFVILQTSFVSFEHNCLTHIFSHSDSSTGGGGALFATGGNANVSVRFCKFANNSAPSYGGAIFCSRARVRSIHSCEFQYNRANRGGAINFAYGIEAMLFATNNTFYKNSATDSGGALYIWETALNLSNSFIVSNTATMGGAVYYVGQNSKLFMLHCTFSENRFECAVCIFYSTLIVRNSNFSDNVEDGLFLRNTGTEIVHSSFCNNSITAAGDVSILLLITHTSFSRNSDARSALILSSYRTLIQNCSFIANGDAGISGTITMSRDITMELRLYNNKFLVPNLQSLDQLKCLFSMLEIQSVGNKPATVYLWDTFVQHADKETHTQNNSSMLSISNCVSENGANWTQRFSRFASGKLHGNTVTPNIK